MDARGARQARARLGSGAPCLAARGRGTDDLPRVRPCTRAARPDRGGARAIRRGRRDRRARGDRRAAAAARRAPRRAPRPTGAEGGGAAAACTSWRRSTDCSRPTGSASTSSRPSSARIIGSRRRRRCVWPGGHGRTGPRSTATTRSAGRSRAPDAARRRRAGSTARSGSARRTGSSTSIEGTRPGAQATALRCGCGTAGRSRSTRASRSAGHRWRLGHWSRTDRSQGAKQPHEAPRDRPRDCGHGTRRRRRRGGTPARQLHDEPLCGGRPHRRPRLRPLRSRPRRDPDVPGPRRRDGRWSGALRRSAGSGGHVRSRPLRRRPDAPSGCRRAPARVPLGHRGSPHDALRARPRRRHRASRQGALGVPAQRGLRGATRLARARDPRPRRSDDRRVDRAEPRDQRAPPLLSAGSRCEPTRRASRGGAVRTGRRPGGAVARSSLGGGRPPYASRLRRRLRALDRGAGAHGRRGRALAPRGDVLGRCPRAHAGAREGDRDGVPRGDARAPARRAASRWDRHRDAHDRRLRARNRDARALGAHRPRGSLSLAQPRLGGARGARRHRRLPAADPRRPRAGGSRGVRLQSDTSPSPRTATTTTTRA